MFIEEEAGEIADYLIKKDFCVSVNPCKYPNDDLCSVSFIRPLTKNIRAGYDQPSAELVCFKDYAAVDRFVRKYIKEKYSGEVHRE